MLTILKNYLVGVLFILLLIGVLFEPYYFAVWVGMNTSFILAAYVISVLFQVAVVFFLIYLPYKLGQSILSPEDSKK